MFNNPHIKKGNAVISIPRLKPVTLQAVTLPIDLSFINEDGQEMFVKTIDDSFTFKSPGIPISIQTQDDSALWFINYQTDEITYDPADPVPLELAIQDEPSMLDRMKAMIAQELRHQFGANNNEIETLEESLDFDINGDGEIGSPYEYQEMDEEEPPELEDNPIYADLNTATAPEPPEAPEPEATPDPEPEPNPPS